MAGACPASLAIAVAQAGGLGGCGALLMRPEAIRAWAAEVRSNTNGGFQLNLWIPDPPPHRDATNETLVRTFLSKWGPDVPPEAGDASPVDFVAQCEAILDAGPAIVSSIMGLYPEAFVARLKERGIKWFANVTTVAEARAAVDAGADAVVAQGMEAGGHRGAFDADKAGEALVGLFALLPAVVDAVGHRVPVVATGGIADARGIAAVPCVLRQTNLLNRRLASERRQGGTCFAHGMALRRQQRIRSLERVRKYRSKPARQAARSPSCSPLRLFPDPTRATPHRIRPPVRV